MNIEDIIYHLGEEPSSAIPASPPIYQTTNFTYDSLRDMQHALRHEDQIPFYTRGTNPTLAILQKKLAALEGMEAALAFGSGSAAIAAAVLHHCKTGSHIVCVNNPYSWTKVLITKILARFQVAHTFVDGSKLSNIRSAIRPETTLIYLESPNSWTYEMQDLAAIASEARVRGIRTLVDNSFASPLYQNPAHSGIDMVVHSATKYIGGHSDVVAGALCSSEAIIRDIFKSEYMTLGGILSPFDAWLLIRSLRTFPMRMEKVSQNAREVAAFLEQHPKISRLFYPQCSQFAQAELANKYLQAGGGLMTIDLKTDSVERIEDFCNSLKYFKLGCSWGGFESLAFPAITTLDSLNYHKSDLIINRIRLYVGLDQPQTLIADLDEALQKV